jgi:hypothetical protein
MRSLVLHEVGVDQSHNFSAQSLILFKAVRIKDLESDLKISVTNENGWILLVAVSRPVQEPALIRIWVFYLKTRIEALDDMPGKTIVDPRTIIFTKDDPGFASGIPNDVLPISSRAGDEEGPE